MVEGKGIHRTRFGVNELGLPVDESLGKLLKLLAERYKLRAFVVFGSRARGDWKPWSDTDVVIILELDAPLKWGKLWELDLPKEAFRLAGRACVEERIFTPKQFRELLRSFGFTALDALEEGVVLYDDGFWEGLKSEFEEMKRKKVVQKTEKGWILRSASA